VLAALVVGSLAGCDWSQIAYGPDHTGFSADQSISPDAAQSSLTTGWTAAPEGGVDSSPAIAGGKAYVAGKDHRLYAYDAAGSLECSGTPTSCAPLWTSEVVAGTALSSPAVVGGIVYVTSDVGLLMAFDAGGVTSCSGAPKVCAPMWSTQLSGAVTSPPTVAGGRVYVVSASATADTLFAIDAINGMPQWTSTVVTDGSGATEPRTAPAVANGSVFAGFRGVVGELGEAPQSRVMVFDTAASSCAGEPVTCSARWATDTEDGDGVTGTPTVSGGVLYVSGRAFDATGAVGCDDTTRRCLPMWSMSGTGDVAVANGVVYQGRSAFDARGITSCSGVPKVCEPLWTAAISADRISAASVAFGVVYLATARSGGYPSQVAAFDAAASSACTGTAPPTCPPRWSASTGSTGGALPPSLPAPAVSDGRVYVGSVDGKVHAFGLEKVAPTTSVLAPRPGDPLSGTTVLAATASDNVHVGRVEFVVNGGGLVNASLGAATRRDGDWFYSWDTSGRPDGAYRVSSVAIDDAGNLGNSAEVAFTLQNHAPSQAPATVSADSLPTVQVTGIVWAQTIVGNTVYATGNFTKARPAGAAAGVNEVTRTHLLAYDITTGQLLPFNHTLNGEGRAIAVTPDGKRIYVGGNFTTVDGASHPRLVAFNTSDGSIVTSFTGGVNNSVRAVTATNGAVYAGGGFSAASNGQLRGRLVAFSAAGALLDWKPSADLTVASMVMSPNRALVIFGGSFTKVNGTTYHGLAAADAQTGIPAPWASQSDDYLIRDDGVNSGITSLSANGSTVFLTGFNFQNIAKPGGLESRAAFDPVAGAVVWINDCHGDSYSAVPIGNVLYSVGHAHDCQPAGAFPEVTPRVWRRALAETIYATHMNGPPTNGYWGYEGVPASTQLVWYPEVNTGTYSGSSQGGWSIVGNTSYVAMGGEFTKVNGKSQQALTRFAVRSLAPNQIGPEPLASPGVTASVANSFGQVGVTWRATWDRDDGLLTYRLYRDGGATPVSTKTMDSRFWNLPIMTFLDTGLTPGSTHSYRLVVSDPYGNTVTAVTGGST
jgi:hypothetical protein